MTNLQELVCRLWNDCGILRDDKLLYGGCVEQLKS